VIGWDAAGVVIAVGPDVTLFQPGDTVYAGASADPAPTPNITWLTSARRREAEDADCRRRMLPLTSITAWETCSIDLT